MIVAVAMSERWRKAFFSSAEWERLKAMAELRLLPEPLDVDVEALDGVELLITGWGTPRLRPEVVAASPALRAIVHSGGSVQGLVDREIYRRGIQVATQADLNAIPVAQFCLAHVLLGAKRAGRAARAYHSTHSLETFTGEGGAGGGFGVFGASVGLIGYGNVCRHLIGLLRPFGMDVCVNSPFLSEAEARASEVRLVPLDQAMACDVVSVHLGATPENYGVITAELLALIRDDATFINTARGIVVDEPALVRELLTGRFDAVLDVTWPEIPEADSPLWSLPNVILTPHWAGSLGRELRRLGQGTVDNVAEWIAGEKMTGAVDPALAPHLA